MKIYTREEVAEILKVSVYAVRDYIKSGKLKTVANMGNIRITEEALNEFIRGK